MCKHAVTLIPGDGIGPEVAFAAKKLIDSVGVQIKWDIQDAGAGVIEHFGTPLPQHVIESIRT